MKLKDIKYKLQLYDGIWSVPLAFFLFWLTGLGLNMIDYRIATYDLSFIQPIFLTSSLVIFFTNAAVFGLFFTFRGIFRYLYGYKDNNTIINQSKLDWKEITAWQRFLLSFGLFALFLAVHIIMYRMFF